MFLRAICLGGPMTQTLNPNTTITLTLILVAWQALSLSTGAPPTTANDKHYQCYTTWPRDDEFGYLGIRSHLLPVCRHAELTAVQHHRGS